MLTHSVISYGLYPTRLLCAWDSPSKNTRVGCHFLLLGIFQTQGSNPSVLGLLHCRQILYHWAANYLMLKLEDRGLCLLWSLYTLLTQIPPIQSHLLARDFQSPLGDTCWNNYSCQLLWKVLFGYTKPACITWELQLAKY